MHQFRNPKTKQELSYLSFSINDPDVIFNNVKYRHKRYKLPTSYDDIVRQDIYDRSWKRHRRTQYLQISS